MSDRLFSKPKENLIVPSGYVPNVLWALGTYPEGTIRFSFGFKNNLSEIETSIKALEEIFNGI